MTSIAGGTGWQASAILALLTLVAGYLTACVVHSGAERRRGQATRSVWRSRLRKAETTTRHLDQETRRLAEALQERESELATLRAAATFEDQGREALQQALHQARLERNRQRAALSALQAALEHAKRAQANMEERLASLREQMRQQQRQHLAVGWASRTDVSVPRSTSPTAAAAAEQAKERIVEIPVDRIVYRDREVPVEVPIEVPVGFTTIKGSLGVDGLKP